jgi:hypothetical protein
MVGRIRAFARFLTRELLDPQQNLHEERVKVYDEEIRRPEYQEQCRRAVEGRFPLPSMDTFLKAIQPGSGDWINITPSNVSETESDDGMPPMTLTSQASPSAADKLTSVNLNTSPVAGPTIEDLYLSDDSEVGNQLAIYRDGITADERMKAHHDWMKAMRNDSQQNNDENTLAGVFSQTGITPLPLSSTASKGEESPGNIAASAPSASGYSNNTARASQEEATRHTNNAPASTTGQLGYDDNLMGIPILQLRRYVGDHQAELEASANALKSFMRSRIAETVAEPSSPLNFIAGHNLWEVYNENLPHFACLKKVLTPMQGHIASIFALDLDYAAFIYAMYEPKIYQYQAGTRFQVLAGLLRIDIEFAGFLEYSIAKEKAGGVAAGPINHEDALRVILQPMVQDGYEEVKLTRLRFPPGLAHFARHKQLAVIEIGNLRSIFANETLKHPPGIVEELRMTFRISDQFAVFLFNCFKRERMQAWE